MYRSEREKKEWKPIVVEFNSTSRKTQLDFVGVGRKPPETVINSFRNHEANPKHKQRQGISTFANDASSNHPSVDISSSSATQEIKPIHTLRTGLASIVPQRHSLSMLYGWRVGLASILSKK
ncbi:hypothetical protein P8452_72220 [Trifolium repens]|nr:hypothetical protein P8452_72220 [Trifolium repens]